MRKSPIEEGKRWLDQAKEDLKWAKYLAKEGGYYLACFLAQQIGEKALKAYLYAQGEEIVIGHSIARLCNLAAEYDKEFLLKLGKWSILDGFYVPTRYPNCLPDSIPAKIYNDKIAQESIELAEEIVSFIENKIFKDF